MIYYAITPTEEVGIAAGYTRYANEGDYDKVYNLIIELTNNHEKAANASNWCKTATIGEVYTDNYFTIEVFEE